MIGLERLLRAAALIVPALLAACAAPGPSGGLRADQRASIELLVFPGCPNTPELRGNLRAALATTAAPAFIDTDLTLLPEDDPRRGWPAPTILVNGRDLFGMAAPDAPALGCRMYAGGVPSAAKILTSREAAGVVRRDQ